MHITILGAGAVGGYLGGRLEEAGIQVNFLVRERRAEQLRNNGLKLNSVQGDYTVQNLNVYTDADQIEECDVVLLTVKSYHLEGAIPQIKPLVEKGAKVLPFLNGMEHFQLLEDEFGKEEVLGGLAYIISTLDEKGHIVHTSEMHDFIFGPLQSGQEKFCDQLEQSLSTANLNEENTHDIYEKLWQKYTFITAFSGVTTTSRLPIGTIRETPATLELFQKTINEMKNLAKAYGTDLPEDLQERVTTQINGLPEEATSSMHQDFRKDLAIEVEGLHGGALRMAKDKSLEMPVIHTQYALLKPYEDGSN